MEIKMLHQYLLGIVTLLLGFLVFIGLRAKLEARLKKLDRINNREVVTQKRECSGAVGKGDVDVIIVGAGVAGSTLAYVLGKDGRRVHVIERNLGELDRIVGEFLQPGGYMKLIELGLGDCVEEIDAQKIFGYAIFKDGKSTKITYPSNVVAKSFHNGRFIQRLRDKATNLSNVYLEQGTVTSLLEENGIINGVNYTTKNGKELKAYAPLTIVCDGCFSNLRRHLCNPKVELLSSFVGLILEDCQLPYMNYGHVILGDPSIFLLYPISSNEVRCLVDIPGTLPSIANGDMAVYLKNVVAPQIPDGLRHKFILAVDRGNIRTMPNKCMPASAYATPGALLLGDAFNMRHPLTGGGMTVALFDITVLRDLLNHLHDFQDLFSLNKYLECFHISRKPTAYIINTIAGISYKMVAFRDQERNEIVQALLAYLAHGGANSEVVLTLLSGLDIHPWSIIVFIIKICIYVALHLLLPFPSVKKLWTAARMTLVVFSVMIPIMRQEGVWRMLLPRRIPY